MKTKIVIIMLLTLIFCVSVAQAGDWQNTIMTKTGGTKAFCIVGENAHALDGVDSLDVPHPPFYPPGRCFIYLKEPGFPQPYNHLWYEYKQHSSSKVFNLSCFWYPWDEEGTFVTLDWKPEPMMNSGYNTITLMPIGIDMLQERHYTFYSEPYQTTNLQILMQE